VTEFVTFLPKAHAIKMYTSTVVSFVLADQTLLSESVGAKGETRQILWSIETRMNIGRKDLRKTQKKHKKDNHRMFSSSATAEE